MQTESTEDKDKIQSNTSAGTDQQIGQTNLNGEFLAHIKEINTKDPQLAQELLSDFWDNSMRCINNARNALEWLEKHPPQPQKGI
ncbi:hypothetical protein [Helicobacter bizzozeronii]|uniref:Uncharacterized protein n=1 Tax=Helicobacter bizzozeronii (strain CIII-1) TaxID=1002804 RepID=F8KUH2_HELBC|nr:hypothetical protein [Helicobacter bizzozeronii]CCB80907.1 hypothetical protein HBZC1_p0270 [Helicobacter bizzozeronii CIII-1]